MKELAGQLESSQEAHIRLMEQLEQCHTQLQGAGDEKQRLLGKSCQPHWTHDLSPRWPLPQAPSVLLVLLLIPRPLNPAPAPRDDLPRPLAKGTPLRVVRVLQHREQQHCTEVRVSTQTAPDMRG